MLQSECQIQHIDQQKRVHIVSAHEAGHYLTGLPHTTQICTSHSLRVLPVGSLQGVEEGLNRGTQGVEEGLNRGTPGGVK